MITTNSRRRLLTISLIALTMGVSLVGVAGVSAQTPNFQHIPDGEKVKKHRGIVSKRSGEMWTGRGGFVKSSGSQLPSSTFSNLSTLLMAVSA